MSRLPERDRRAAAGGSGRIKWRPSNTLIAIVFILIFTVGPYLAFTKHVPFTGYGYELKATFSNSANIAKNSPIRIAGVDVGKVIGTERDGNNTKVNFFIELDPGSPSAAEMDSGGTIPVSRTSTAVQIDEVLSALQTPVRADLGRLLEGYGKGLNHQPTPTEDETQLPEVKGRTGAEALNGALQYGGDAGRYSAQVANAL